MEPIFNFHIKVLQLALKAISVKLLERRDYEKITLFRHPEMVESLAVVDVSPARRHLGGNLTLEIESEILWKITDYIEM